MNEIEGEIELKAKQTLSPEYKKTKKKIILKNLWISIFIMIYFTFLDLGNYNIDKAIFITDLHVFSIAILIFSIYLFEKGYKKDDEGIFLNGVEALFVAITTLIMPYTMFEAGKTVHLIASFAFIYFVIYYAIKTIVQVVRLRKKYKASDVRELVKKNSDKEN